jgi:hypothetical protein
VEKPEGRKNLEDAGVDGRIILKWIFEKWYRGHGLDRSGSRQGQEAGWCECGNETSCRDIRTGVNKVKGLILNQLEAYFFKLCNLGLWQ